MSREYSLKHTARVCAEVLKDYSIQQEKERRDNWIVALWGLTPEQTSWSQALELAGRVLRKYDEHSRKVENQERLRAYKDARNSKEEES